MACILLKAITDFDDLTDEDFKAKSRWKQIAHAHTTK